MTKRIILITAIVVAAILYFMRKPPRVPGVDYSITEDMIGCFLEPLPTMSGDARWYGNEYD